MRFRKKILKKIDKRKIRKKQTCLWNIYKQFGYDIYDKNFKDSKKYPLYQNCIWTEEQEKEMIKLMKEKKVKCAQLGIGKYKKYNCHGCMLIFHFPICKEWRKK